MRQHNTEVDHDSIVYLLNPTHEQLHHQRAYYFANVTMIDEKIGQILEALETKGYLDNAIVVFTSDHGDCLSDHGHSLNEPFGQIFNLTEDPDEIRNLWDEPSVTAKKQELLHVLLEWRIRSRYHTRELFKDWR